MNGEHPLPNPRERDIFNEARNLTSLQKRAEYLDGACGDDHALRASIEALLKNYSEDDSLENFGGEVRSSVFSGEQIGDTIGNYKLLEVIGEGGCGMVYLAEQQKPLQRRVALKVIKKGLDIKQVTQRFEAERQVLAKLTHSSIAKIYDAGSTKEGRPYFVMELVQGEKITTYADSRRLTINQRLELFVKVCQAVDYAHEKGFIHRDIKPSNILVTEESGEPLPKVIDFGITKATVEIQGEKNFTITGQFVGTPAYTSPEQADCNRKLPVDRRTDIYSLGVLLYELLVGCLPLSLNGLEAKDQLLAICGVEFPKPSVRLTTLGKGEISNIAQFRQIEPSHFLETLQQELDRIVVKCLEKAPESRYQTASSLAFDIQGYLKECKSDEAHILGAFYKRKKFLYTVGTSLVGAVLVGAMVKWGSNPSSEQEKFLSNKKIFLQIEKAVSAPTFEGAQIILNEIDISKITDGELASYISICKKIANFCVEVGIPRSSSPTWLDMLRDVDFIKFAGHVISHPIETIQKAREIKQEIPQFEQLDQTLSQRYGGNK